MPGYLVERYTPPSDLAELHATTDRIRRVVAAARRRGDLVRYVRSIVVASEENSFWLFTADGAESVRRVLGEAGVTFERIVEAEVSAEEPGSQIRRRDPA